MSATTTTPRWRATIARARQADWPFAHISAYATCHPFEDFAETWAHYMHIVDTLETAASFGLSVNPGT